MHGCGYVRGCERAGCAGAVPAAGASARGFSPGEPKKCKESVFEAQILYRNQANPQIL